MKTLIIGATGKIGSLLVPKLIDAGHDVVALARDADKAEPLAEAGADLCIADIESDYTILRPGPLRDDPATGRIRIAGHLDDADGAITREDVADCVRLTLDNPNTIRKTFNLLNGDQPLAQSALASSDASRNS